MVGACYSALLVAVLTVDEAAPQLDTLQQLAASGLGYTDVDDVWPGQLALSDDASVHRLMERFQMSDSWRHLQQRLRTNTFTYTAECLDSGFLCLQEPLPPDLLEKLHLSRFVDTLRSTFLMACFYALRTNVYLLILNFGLGPSQFT